MNQENLSKQQSSIKSTVRYIAVDVLWDVKKNKAFSNLLLDSKIKKNQLSKKDSGLLTELVYGTISREITLDYYLHPFIKNAKKVEDWVRILLHLSIYQLVYLDKVPPHAVLNEAVMIAKKKGNIGTSKFVNGVLRSIQRQGIPDVAKIENPIERLSVELSIPEWLIAKLVNQVGSKRTREIGLSLLIPSHVSGRIGTQLISRGEALEELSSEGIEAVESEVSPYGIVGKRGYLAGSDLFKKGEMTVQDESSMLVAPAMQIEPQHKVLDACAAPGGKTTHIATFLDSQKGGQVVALDLHPHKIKLIEENAKRLHVENAITTQLLDARKIDEEYPDDYFDRILVDAPCSGLGLMRRKPDIKYQKKEEEVSGLPNVQLAILESVASKLKPEGILTYSTCTILKEENQQVVATFLNRHPEFRIVEVRGTEILKEVQITEGVLIYPDQYKTDGFFICCLKREKANKK